MTHQYIHSGGCETDFYELIEELNVVAPWFVAILLGQPEASKLVDAKRWFVAPIR